MLEELQEGVCRVGMEESAIVISAESNLEAPNK